MDKRIMGLLGAVGALVAGLAATSPAQAALRAPSPEMLLQARSYAEPALVVPESLATLQGLDEVGSGVELVQERGYRARRYARRHQRRYYRRRR